MPGVPRELAEHSLNIRPNAKPVKQPLQRFAEEKKKAIGEEIARLLAAGFIMEVFYPDWLANPVLVLKKNNTWRMCIDYTSLNKACPKDPFTLSRAGASLTWENVVDVGASSSSVPGNGAKKILNACGTVNVHRPVGNPKRKV
jgi:hypothetical protein